MFPFSQEGSKSERDQRPKYGAICGSVGRTQEEHDASSNDKERKRKILTVNFTSNTKRSLGLETVFTQYFAICSITPVKHRE